MGDQKEHFDLEPADHPPDAPAPLPTSSGQPKPAPKPTVTPASPAEAPPLLELAEDKCPKCGTPLRPEAVFCIKCGYDLRTNEVRTPTLGIEHVAEKPPEESKDFSAPGRGSIKVLLGIGGAISLAAMVVAGLNSPPGMRVVASVILCLYEIILNTGTGLVAVLIAARVAELKPGKLDLAAARIFVAFAAFQLIHIITFGEYRLLVTLLMYPIAVAAYWGLIMFLFRKPRVIATTVLVAHVVLWLAVKAGMELSAYVESAPPAARSIDKPQTPG
jgi:hypothetical protein